MTDADIPAGMRLKDLAGWNQTSEDWRRFLSASPEGCFVAEAGGKVVGTATTITYENRFAWIGMVLVDPEFRGRGIGTRLLERTLEFLDAAGVPTMKLDATPQGKPIYEKLGFVNEFEIERWTLDREPAEQPVSGAGVRDLEYILAWDREIFGADRSGLLRSIHDDTPGFTLAGGRGSELLGYSFGRRGSLADHLGPWAARDEATARELLEEFLRRSHRARVFVDVVTRSPFAPGLLKEKGFAFARPLTRMVRGPNRFPGRPEMLCAVLGPEFG